MREGDICSVRSGEGDYVVVKILKLEEGVVHVRVYANRFAERPRDIVDEELRLGSVFDEEFGVGHLPLDPGAFAEWKPELIRHASVGSEELEGYEMWREAEDEGTGGVWGRPEEREGLRGKLRRLFRRD